MFENDYSTIDLSNIGDGGLAEDFSVAIADVVNDITNINKTDGKRSINIKIDFAPAEDRRSAQLTWQIETKLAKLTPGSEITLLGNNPDGKNEKTLYRVKSEQSNMTAELFRENDVTQEK